MTRGRSPYPHAAVKAEKLFSSGHGAKEVSDQLGVTISPYFPMVPKLQAHRVRDVALRSQGQAVFRLPCL